MNVVQSKLFLSNFNCQTHTELNCHTENSEEEKGINKKPRLVYNLDKLIK